jgi:hypothetical protein
MDVADLSDLSDLPPLRKLTLQTFAGYTGQQVDRRDCHPLNGLDLARRNGHSGLGLGEHLTSLVLQDLQLVHFKYSVGSKLAELPVLEELRLVRVYAWPPPGTTSGSNDGATVWKELVRGVSD